MKLAKNGEAGQIFVWALILLAIGPLLVVPMLRLSSSSQGYNQITEIYTLNTYAADAGAEYGKYQIYNNPAEILASGLDEDIVVNNIDVHVTADYVPGSAAYEIHSTAGGVESSVTLEVSIVIDVGLFGNVVAVDGDLVVDNCNFVATEEGEADIHTNGDIEIKGNSYVDGDVNASGTIDVLPDSTVTGDINEGVEAIEFPTIIAQIQEDKAKAGGTYTGDYTLDGGTNQLGPLYIDGKLDVSGDGVLELTGTVYVTGDVDINHTEITGFGDIATEGNFALNNYSINVDTPEILPLLMSVNQNMSINHDDYGGNPGTFAIMYAPNGTIDLNNVELTGSIAAKLVVIVSAFINYPAEMRGRADLPGAGLDTVTYLFE